ncbi:heme biosynthesis HemY N-terminal domain-containing protein [Phenylobacterium sp. J367]|uniref:heme biosynthesis HemY N-terminal domain-containing protein n=1 Tax=Phenylobacterium sp. J367 TaxID=2898435 RepID=UPI002150DCD9|nr:heme biosynthesis HemY N-terminal domain-containing protein [Phenylobacterium sp. J367]MCR5878276.1 tetratricopeptide repeat protein [Phenylobacterium sp. J367]
MIRAGLVVLLVLALAVAVLALTGDPGRANLVWLGWRVDMTAATAVLLVGAGALLATVIWRTLIWILEAPARSERARAEARRRQADEVLTRGFLAVAAGDGSEARRLAGKAADLAVEAPGLARILAAQAAEAAGDPAAMHAAYTAMLGLPEMRLAGHKGLMQLAFSQGDRDGGLRHAEAAFGEARTTRWAWRALLEARLEIGDWDAALDLVKRALDRKVVSPLVAERARAALLAARAAQLEHAPEPRARAEALDSAVEAARLQPGFSPGVVMAARLLARDGKAQRAAGALEAAWKAQPHPALYLAYRDLRTDETPKARAARLMALAAGNPAHRESRILYVEQALIAGDAAGAAEAARALDGEPATARIAGLMARVAYAGGRPDEARVWMARGMSAPHEPDWSDLDPEGRAFAYHASDWARLVATFAETGELIHPRLERRERGLPELPELPLTYADQAALLGPDGGEPVLYPAHEEPFGDDEPPPAPPSAPRPAPPAPRPREAPLGERREVR